MYVCSYIYNLKIDKYTDTLQLFKLICICILHIADFFPLKSHLWVFCFSIHPNTENNKIPQIRSKFVSKVLQLHYNQSNNHLKPITLFNFWVFNRLIFPSKGIRSRLVLLASSIQFSFNRNLEGN